MPDKPETNAHPRGAEFLRLAWRQLDRCELNTQDWIGHAGERAPATLEGLADVLSHLHQYATCGFRCRDGDHLIERLAGRSYSLAVAASRLWCFGQYDESLLLTRSIGEIANLVFLFAQDPESFAAWSTASENDRRRDFSPVKASNTR